MRIDSAGWPFILLALVPALAAWALGASWAAAGLALLAAFFAFFFRDPPRTIDAPAHTLVSPADGRVMAAGPSASSGFPADAWQQVTIFLSPMDVHVNRMPVSGMVRRVVYHPGRFLPAYKPESGDLNEYTEVTLDHEGTTIVVRQVVGILARRIVCRVKPGDVVGTGERFGVMKFGSRMDVFVPPTAVLHVQAGQRVVAGITRLATLEPAAEGARA